MTGALQALLDEGVALGVFPCAAAVVRREGMTTFAGGAGGAGPDTVFDLASLTKVVATTAAFMALWADGRLDPETPVARHLPAASAVGGGITVEDLLVHRSGLPAFVPLFAPVLSAHPGLLEPGCPPALRATARRETVSRALATPPVGPPGARAVYSDLGFLLLGEILAEAGRVPLDVLVAERVASPLGLALCFRRLSAGQGTLDGPVVPPTGATRPREPAPGQEGLWDPGVASPSAPGEVDDDNAWVMDGVAGHAGLFGSAAAVAAFGQAILDEIQGAGRLAPAPRWERALRRDTVTPDSTRAFGFDTRVPGDDPGAGASAGVFLGQVAPGAAGHLGFTGTSLWIDRGRRLVVALCTNRTALGRANTRIRDFRPRFHDAVVAAAEQGRAA